MKGYGAVNDEGVWWEDRHGSPIFRTLKGLNMSLRRAEPYRKPERYKKIAVELVEKYDIED